jgi:hypothetical protein
LQRINQVSSTAPTQLQQRDLGIEGIAAAKFGIHRHLLIALDAPKVAPRALLMSQSK